MSKPQETPASAAERSETIRKPYQKPELQVYGDLAEITQTVSGSKTNDGSAHVNKHFTS